MEFAEVNVFCPQCGVAICEDDVNVGANAALCRACDSIFDLRGVVGGERPMASPDAWKTYPRPAYYRLSETGERLRIKWRWFRPVLLFFAIWSIGWNAGAISWLVGSLTGRIGCFWIIPAAIFLAIGLPIAYVTFLGFINSTELVVTRREIRVAHMPIPVEPRVVLPADEVEQLYCELEKPKAKKKRDDSRSFRLMALLKSGAMQPVVESIDRIEEVRFLEQRIERYLGIRPRRVEGEYLGDTGNS